METTTPNLRYSGMLSQHLYWHTFVLSLTAKYWLFSAFVGVFTNKLRPSYCGAARAVKTPTKAKTF
jgi:hypothetical protein